MSTESTIDAEAVGTRDNAYVVFIHGTGAGDADDEGEKWWQRESAFCVDLQSRLGTFAKCSPAKGTFHWNEGPNSEHARRVAGARLLQWLSAFEAQGLAYHVIAHSHGGSIMWHALLESVRLNRPLRHLRTWTTVGTPFLQFRPDHTKLWNLAPFGLAAAIAATSFDSVLRTWRGWSELLDADLVAATISLWTIYALIVGILLFSAVQLLQLAFARLQNSKREHASQRAWQAYGERWEGLWSTEDEAINGLSATLGFAGAIVPRATPWGTSAVGRLFSALTGPFRWIYNAVVARCADEFVWDRLKKRFQGNDLAASQLVSVSPTPFPLAIQPSAPPEISEPLRELANREAARALASIRSSLSAQTSAPDLPTFLGQAAGLLSWNELIHNSYFDVDAVRSHLAKKVIASAEPAPIAVTADAASVSAEPPAANAKARHHAKSLLPAMVALGLFGILGTAKMAHTTIYNSTVATFEDDYQIKLAIAQVPLDDAVKESFTQSVQILEDWSGALIDTGRFDEGVAVAVRHPEGRGIAIAQLLARNRPDLVAVMVKTVQQSGTKTSMACDFAVAVQRLIKLKHSAQAQAAFESLLLLNADAAVPAVDCSVMTETRSLGSAEEAVDFARSLLAANALLSGVSVDEVVGQYLKIVGEQQRSDAIRQGIARYLERGEVTNAYKVYQAAPVELYFDPEQRVKIAKALKQEGKNQEAETLVLAASATPNTDHVALALLLAKVGMAEEAYRFLAMNGPEDRLRHERLGEVAWLLAESDHPEGAELALDRLSGYPRENVLSKLANAAIGRRDLAAALAFRAQMVEGRIFDNVPDEMLKAGWTIEAIAAIQPTNTRPRKLGEFLQQAKDKTQVLALVQAASMELPTAPRNESVALLAHVINALSRVGERNDIQALATKLTALLLESVAVAKKESAPDIGDFDLAMATLADEGYVDHAMAVYEKAPQQPDIFPNPIYAKRQPIIRALARVGRLDEAIAWCGKKPLPEDTPFGEIASCGIGQALSSTDAPKARDIAAKLVAAKLPFDAAVFMAKADLRGEVEKAIGSAMAELHDEGWSEVSQLYAELHKWDEAAWAALQVSDVKRQAELLGAQVQALNMERQIVKSLKAALDAKDPERRFSLVVVVAAHAGEADRLAAISALHEVLTQVPLLEESWRAAFRARAAKQLGRLGELRGARIACELCSSVDKTAVYANVVRAGHEGPKRSYGADATRLAPD